MSERTKGSSRFMQDFCVICGHPLIFHLENTMDHVQGCEVVLTGWKTGRHEQCMCQRLRITPRK